MFSLLFTFCLHFYLIHIHVFDYLDSRLSGLFAEVLKSPDNRGSTVIQSCSNVSHSVVYNFFSSCGIKALFEKQSLFLS